VPSKLRRFRNRLVTQQHGPVQWLAHNLPIELGSGDGRIIDRKQAAISQALEQHCHRRNCAPGSAIEERLCQFWEAADLADHQTAHLHDARREYSGKLSVRIALKLIGNIFALGEFGHFTVEGTTGEHIRQPLQRVVGQVAADAKIPELKLPVARPPAELRHPIECLALARRAARSEARHDFSLGRTIVTPPGQK
jgi:hypothetical protein